MIEKAIATALENLTGKPFVANISQFVVTEPNGADVFLGKPSAVSMQLRVTPPADYVNHDAPWDEDRQKA
jgi:hypothetical protein